MVCVIFARASPTVAGQQRGLHAETAAAWKSSGGVSKSVTEVANECSSVQKAARTISRNPAAQHPGYYRGFTDALWRVDTRWLL